MSTISWSWEWASLLIFSQQVVDIEKMESDKDHIHILVSAKPNISPYSIISAIKQKTTYELWQKHQSDLKKVFWKDHVFWTKSYFVASIGSVSKDAIMRYIENQGGSSAALKNCGLAA
jgi:putative transposase